MAASAAEVPARQLADALVNFSVYGQWPGEDELTMKLESHVLPPAIQALADAKARLQVQCAAKGYLLNTTHAIS
jgi:protein transport protein DSL1/ZW10